MHMYCTKKITKNNKFWHPKSDCSRATSWNTLSVDQRCLTVFMLSSQLWRIKNFIRSFVTSLKEHIRVHYVVFLKLYRITDTKTIFYVPIYFSRAKKCQKLIAVGLTSLWFTLSGSGQILEQKNAMRWTFKLNRLHVYCRKMIGPTFNWKYVQWASNFVFR